MRNAYFTLLVDVETLAVTRALAQFSDEIYRLQAGLAEGHASRRLRADGLEGPDLSPTAWRTSRRSQSYVYDWKALVATLGLPQLPLSEVAGEVDRFIPYYDYDRSALTCCRTTPIS